MRLHGMAASGSVRKIINDFVSLFLGNKQNLQKYYRKVNNFYKILIKLLKPIEK